MTILEIKGNKYTLVFNYRSLVKLEEMGLDITNGMNNFKISDISKYFYAGLLKFHKDMTIEKVYDLIDDALDEEGKGFEYLTDKLTEAFNKSFGKK